MSFLKKIFGSAGSLSSLEKAFEQRRFADVRRIADDLLSAGTESAERSRIEELRSLSSDALARLNLDEGLGLLRCGQPQRATEHLTLAAQQASSAELRQQVAQALAEAGPAAGEPLKADSAECLSAAEEMAERLDPDHDSQLELILSSYPETVRARYLSAGDLFVAAFLAAHGGDDEKALALWQEVDESERDALFCFEYGATLARLGRLEEACGSLTQACSLRPDLQFVQESLAAVLMGVGEFAAAQQQLEHYLQTGGDAAFAHGQLALLAFRQQEYPAAVAEISSAIEAGNRDGQFLLFAASLLEQKGEVKEAERILKLLPVSGCSGQPALPLAEFWLRQKRELAKALDLFNAACRDDPQNPRWQLRVAQTYAARRWSKDALKLIRKVVSDPRLEQPLVREAEELLAQLENC